MDENQDEFYKSTEEERRNFARIENDWGTKTTRKVGTNFSPKGWRTLFSTRVQREFKNKSKQQLINDIFTGKERIFEQSKKKNLEL